MSRSTSASGRKRWRRSGAETGLTVGPVVGTKTHKVIKDVGPLEFVEDRLKDMGLTEMHQELALLHGKPSYRKGHRKIDVVEFYNNDNGLHHRLQDRRRHLRAEPDGGLYPADHLAP